MADGNQKQIKPAAFLTSPDYYLWKLEGSEAHFRQMNRDRYQESIFTDARIMTSGPGVFKVDIDKLINISQQLPLKPQKLSYIFHVAHCGSTLLSQALDVKEKNIVYREPLSLRQHALNLAVDDQIQSPSSRWTEILKLVTLLLNKSYNNTPIIIKANIPVNFIIDRVMDLNPNGHGILLYATFENYLLWVLKSQSHREWVKRVTLNLCTFIDQRIGIGRQEIESLSIIETAACLWLAQISMYNNMANKYKNIKTLDAEYFYNNTELTLREIFTFLENDSVTEQEISDIVQSYLFTRHAKLTSKEYNNEIRLEEKRQLKQMIEGELSAAQDWVINHMERISLPGSLPSPLLGDSPILLENYQFDRAKRKSIKDIKPEARPMKLISDEDCAIPVVRISRSESIQSLDDISDKEIIAGIQREGVILLKGFDYDVEAFAKFSQRFCSHSVHNAGRGREMVEKKNNIQTVSLGASAFPLHAELAREPWRPDVCFFACQSPPTLGGETLICDGVKIVEALSDDSLRQWQAQALRYIRRVSPEESLQWFKTKNPTAADIQNIPAAFPFQIHMENGILKR